MTIGERLKKLRKEIGLTQQEFSDKIKVSRSNIATYEVGKNNPTDAVVNLICREFHVNETWLRTGKGEMFRQDEETIIDRLCAELHADELESAIIQAYFRIDEKIRLPFLRRLIQEVQKHPIQQEELEELETAADAFAAMVKEQFLSEKRRESRASSVRESDAG